MTHYTRTMTRQRPIAAIFGVLVAAALALTIALGGFPPSFDLGTNPAVKSNGELTNGWTQAQIDAAREWERQRRQQSPHY